MNILWLDDIRDPGKLKWSELIFNELGIGGKNICWVKSYSEFVEYVNKFGLPEFIFFDHDLADEHYTPEKYWSSYKESKRYQSIVSKDYKEKTGFDCAKWLVDYCIDNELDLPKYTSHSANPVGRDNIVGLLDNYLKFSQRA